MNRYTGKVYFYKYLDSGVVTCAMPLSGDSKPIEINGTIVIGSCEVDVELNADTRQQEVEALQAEVNLKNAEHQHWLDMMNGKIQSLLAIEHEVPE